MVDATTQTYSPSRCKCINQNKTAIEAQDNIGPDLK